MLTDQFIFPSTPPSNLVCSLTGVVQPCLLELAAVARHCKWIRQPSNLRCSGSLRFVCIFTSRRETSRAFFDTNLEIYVFMDRFLCKLYLQYRSPLHYTISPREFREGCITHPSDFKTFTYQRSAAVFNPHHTALSSQQTCVSASMGHAIS